MRAPLLLLAVLLAQGGEDQLDAVVELRLWSDLPSEALREIDRHLPPRQRWCWHADPAADTAAYPGASVEHGGPLRAALDAYAERTRLAWSAGAGCVWIHERADAAAVAAWAAALRGGERDARRSAGERLAAVGPTGMAALIAALAGEDADAALVARDRICRVLGMPAGAATRPETMLLATFGHPDENQVRRIGVAPLGDRAWARRLRAPWAALRLACAEPDAAAAAQRLAGGAAAVASDPVRLAIACAARLPVGIEACALWQSGAERVWRGKRPPEPWYLQRWAPARAALVRAWASGAEAEAPSAESLAAPLRVPAEELAANEKRLGEARGAVARLGQLGGADAVAVLVETIGTSAQPLLREAAAQALGWHRAPAMVPALARAYAQDEQPGVRREAAESLGACRLPSAIDALRAGAADAGSPVGRTAALRALAATRHPEAARTLRALIDGEPAGAGRQVLLQLLCLTRDADAVAFLVARVRGSADAGERAAAAAGLLADPGPTARAAVQELLTTGEPAVRALAVARLAPRDRDDARRLVPTLVQAIDGEREDEQAVGLLRALQLCAQLTESEDAERAAVAAAALRAVRGHASGTVRREALGVFRATGTNAVLLAELARLRDTVKDPVLKQSLSMAVVRGQSIQTLPDDADLGLAAQPGAPR